MGTENTGAEGTGAENPLTGLTAGDAAAAADGGADGSSNAFAPGADGGAGDGAEGDGADWKAGMGDLAGNPALKDFKDPTALAKSYVELYKKMGSGELAIPGPDADDETVNKFYDKLRPENAADYKLQEKPEDLPEGVEWNTENAEAFEKFAHENGFTVKQAQAINAWATEKVAGVAGSAEEVSKEASAARQVEFEAAAEKHWGSKDASNKAIAAAGNLLNKYAGPEDLEAISTLGVTERIILSKALDGIMKDFTGEDIPGDGDGSGFGGGMTEPQLIARQKELMAEPAYFDKMKDVSRHNEITTELSEILGKLRKIRK